MMDEISNSKYNFHADCVKKGVKGPHPVKNEDTADDSKHFVDNFRSEPFD
jgi:hypothetical protein